MPNDYKSIKEDEYPVLDEDSDTSPAWNSFRNRWNNDDDRVDNSARQDVLVPFDQNDPKNSWFKTRWRPAAAWQYIAVCLFDFIIGPVATMFFYYYSGQTYHQWTPLTLQGGGLYHLAMGAVLGVAAWSRGQEKIKQIE